MRPRSLALAGAALAGAAAWVVRRRSARPRVALHAGDGSVVVLDAGDPRAERMLAAARGALAAVRAEA